ncbi:LysR family transcriptional regulator [Streptomyces sp. NPDC058745]|uniref:LysR family transcriptional regulator n=1 Tax=Streptomyces sp. NPDC058745 TaxID=3346621 RepID=UPI003697373F
MSLHDPVSGTFTIDLRRPGGLRELERRGSVARTAAALRLTPSAVSQQLAALARELGVPLVERQGRGVRLTGQARLVLRHADLIAAQLAGARGPGRRAGLGVALAPRPVQPPGRPEVFVRPVAGQPPTRTVFAAVRTGAEADPVLSAVVAVLGGHAARVAERPAP